MAKTHFDRTSFFDYTIYSNGGQKVSVIPEDDNLYLMAFSNKNLITLEKLKDDFENGNKNIEDLKNYKIKNEKYEDLEKYKNLLILRYAIYENLIKSNITNKVRYKVEMLREQNIEKEFNKTKGLKLIDAIAKMSKYEDISFGFVYNAKGDLALDLAIEENGYTEESSIILKKGNDYIFRKSDLDTIEYYIKTAQSKIAEQEKREKVLEKYHSVLNNQFEPEELEILKENKPGWQ